MSSLKADYKPDSPTLFFLSLTDTAPGPSKDRPRLSDVPVIKQERNNGTESKYGLFDIRSLTEMC